MASNRIHFLASCKSPIFVSFLVIIFYFHTISLGDNIDNKSEFYINTVSSLKAKSIESIWLNIKQISVKQGTDSRFVVKANIKSLCPKSTRGSILKSENCDYTKHEY